MPIRQGTSLYGFTTDDLTQGSTNKYEDDTTTDDLDEGAFNKYQIPYTIKAAQASPPGSPANGDTYLPYGTVTGAWVGHANEPAKWNAATSAWVFFTPFEGMSLRNEATTQWIVYASSTWSTLSTDQLPEGSTNFYGNGRVKIEDTAGRDVRIGASDTLPNSDNAHNNIAIGTLAGNAAAATDEKNVNIGYYAGPSATGIDNSVAIGNLSTVSADSATAVGDTAYAESLGSTAIGLNAWVKPNAARSVAVGQGSIVEKANGSDANEAYCMGYAANAKNTHCVSIGAGATSGDDAAGTKAIALGYGSTASKANSVAIGQSATSATANLCRIGGAGANKLDLEIDSTAYFYIGDNATNGSWRFYISTNDLVFERRESGSWVEKGRFTA